MKKLLFNSSLPRSGSELLQVLMHQNPRIYGSVTSPMMEYQFAARANTGLPEVKAQNRALMEKAFDSVCWGIAHSYYDAITERPVVIDKNRGWSSYYNWVDRWNKNPKMICMIRDLRSILASMERVFQKNRHSHEQIEDLRNLGNLTVEQRMNHWLTNVPVGLALKRLQGNIQDGTAGKILIVKYEDLCHTPEKVMERIYDFIEEPYFDHDFKNIEKEVEENDIHFGIFGNHSVRRVLTRPAPSDWSDVLNPEVSNGIREGCAWFFRQFGY